MLAMIIRWLWKGAGLDQCTTLVLSWSEMVGELLLRQSQLAWQQLFSEDLEFLQTVRSEGGYHGDVGSITSASDKNSADPRLVIARIKSVPAVAQIRLEPSIKVHWHRVWRRAYVAEIAIAKSGRNVQAPT
jgi:hypothetical protein